MIQHFIRYRDEMMATETVTSMVISLDLIIRHYERIAQRSAMSIPCFALQDKAISRHFKGVMTSAEAVVAGKDGASVVRTLADLCLHQPAHPRMHSLSLYLSSSAQKLAHKFNRLQTLVICKGVAMLRFVSKTLVSVSRIFPHSLPSIPICVNLFALCIWQGEETVSAALQVMHDRSMEEFEKCRLLITALSKTGTGDQSNTTQDCLIALKSLNEGQATVRTEALEHFIQLYRNATPVSSCPPQSHQWISVLLYS